MRKLIALCVLTSTLAWTTATRAAPPTRESIDTLLAITGVEKTFDGMLANIDALMKRNMAIAFSGQPASPDRQRRIDIMSAKMRDIFREEMSWPKMQPIYEQIHAETFTQEEVDGLIAFYRTPTGVAYVDKLPLILQKSIAATQPLMASMMQKIQAATKQTAEEEKAKN